MAEPPYALVWLRWALARIGYWIRPYDAVLDDRRWRWQPTGICQFQARKSPAEIEAWLREMLGEEEWSHMTSGQIVAMTNTLYARQRSAENDPYDGTP